MRHADFRDIFTDASPVDVSIIMPCLDEVGSLPHCIANATEALDRIGERYGLTGEIVIADNGSTDGSQALATSLGARVVDVAERGYGAAIIGGARGAYGQFLVMGDCDGSYDFGDSVAMIGRLVDGADLCMGSRFQGGIAPGAMPWKNRWIGNPVLTGILNLFFRSGIDDAHCGLRAFTADAFAAMRLSGSGMELASEMVIKASLLKLRIEQEPATLSRDLRDRDPHLRPWRDGWRHLRYLVMLSPTWAFGVPALAALVCAAVILTAAIAGVPQIGTGWSIVGAFLATTSHFAALMAVAMHVQGVREGYRRLRPAIARLAPLLSLEVMLVAGIAMMIASAIGFALVGAEWSKAHYQMLASPLPLILSAMIGSIGLQTLFGGIVLSVVAGHQPALRVGALAFRTS